MRRTPIFEGLRNRLKRTSYELGMVAIILALSGCSPTPYPVGMTLVDGQLGVYVPTCDGWVVDGLSVVSETTGWNIRRVEGPGTNSFILGVIPSGYEAVYYPSGYTYEPVSEKEFVSELSPYDSYSVLVAQSRFKEIADLDTGVDEDAPVFSTTRIYGEFAEEGKLMHDGNSKLETSIDGLSSLLKPSCPK